VIKRIAPEAELIDITHGIPPQQVLQGAITLANTLPYMPAGIHVAVVDPGVGGPRAPLVLEGGDGRLYVGPDNGLLLLAADRLGGVVRAVQIANRAFMLEPVSRTFHGRDVFAPAAAHLSLGVPLEELGPRIEPDRLVRLAVPEPVVTPSGIRARVLSVDRFGNIELNVARDHLTAAGLEPGGRVEVTVAFERLLGVVAETFAEVRPGDIVVFEDAYGSVALAINGGDAAGMLGVRPGQEVGLGAVVPSRE
jgi:S-adenosylmethionine hydrolase